jgi:hypothetical protein
MRFSNFLSDTLAPSFIFASKARCVADSITASSRVVRKDRDLLRTTDVGATCGARVSVGRCRDGTEFALCDVIDSLTAPCLDGTTGGAADAGLLTARPGFGGLYSDFWYFSASEMHEVCARYVVSANDTPQSIHE